MTDVPVPTPACRDCIYWTHIRQSYSTPSLIGECGVLPTGEYAMSSPETDEDFFCAYFKRRTA